MPKIELSGTRNLVQLMRKDITRLKGGVQKTHQNLVRNMLRDVVVNTPQWTGELAMHWGLEFHGGTAPSFTTQFSSVSKNPWAAYKDGWRPYMKGMEPAVSYALARENVKIADIKYNSKVSIVNKMPYASEVEEGRGPRGRGIRVVNQNAGYGKGMMIGYLQAKYSNRSEIRKAIAK